jgi:Mg-chelatase subunit ChlD
MAKKRVSTETKHKRSARDAAMRQLFADYQAGKVKWEAPTPVAAKTVTTTVTTTTVTTTPVKRKNYLMVVLDKSSSMRYTQKQAISAFNETLQTAKLNKADTEVVVSLVTFDDSVGTTFLNKPIDQVDTLNEGNYRPHGNTAMYDGVGDAITELCRNPDIKDPNVNVLVMVISDGEENASRRWRKDQIAALIKQQQATGRWTFSYAGANQNLFEVSRDLNIPIGNTQSFEATPQGFAASNVMRSASVGTFYKSTAGGQSATVDFYAAFPEEKKNSGLSNKAVK